MSIHDKLNEALEKAKQFVDAEDKADSSLTTDLAQALYSQTVIPKTKNTEYLRSAIGWVYGCVGVIADEIASVNLCMYRLKPNGDLVEVDDHVALDVIYRANNATSRFDLMNLTIQYLELTGEAPWYISFKNGRPDQIFLLRPDRLTVKPGKDGELIGGYKYRVYKEGGGFEDIDLEPYEVIPLRYSDPDNPVRGKGPLQAAARTFDLDNYAEKWNSQFFANSATPAGIFQTDKVLSREIRNRLEKKIKEKYQGLKNAHKTMVLEGGLKFEQISLSQKDMDFVLQQQFSRDKLLSIFRVPPTALGLTADVTRANAEATDYVFAKRTILPKLIRIQEQLNEFFLPLFGNSDQLYFEFDNPVPQNVDQEIQRAASGVQNGYMTVNEAREIMGLDPVPDGDVLRDPASMQPVLNINSQPMKAKAGKKKPRPYYKHMNNARSRGKKEAGEKRELIKEMVQKSLTPVIYNLLKAKAKTTVKPAVIKKVQKSVLVNGTWEQIRKAKYDFQEKQLKVADKYEDKFVAKLNTVFEKQKDIILRGLDSGDKMVLKAETEADRYEKALHGVFMDLLREQGALAFQLLGIQKDFSGKTKGFTQTLATYFTERTFKFGQQVARETNDKLRAAFKLSSEKEESIPQIKTRVSELFDNMKDYRSERIARSEIIRGSNYATEQAYMDSGVVEAKEWLTTKDERTDDECIAMDGKIIPLGENFFNKGDTFEGLTLDYENIGFPPLHVNCRCTLIPVISTPIKPGEWRPKMTESQAKDFVKDSQVKKTLYHGTVQSAADNISQNGFNLNATGGTGTNVMKGIYLTEDHKDAANYAISRWGSEAGTSPKNAVIMSAKINVKNLKEFTGTELHDLMYSKFGSGFKIGRAHV